MKRKITIVLVVLCIISPAISSISIVSAQSGFAIDTGAIGVDGVAYSPQSDVVAVLLDSGELRGYDRSTENQLWSVDTGFERPDELAYSPKTDWFYAQGRRSTMWTDTEMRVYDTQGDYQGGHSQGGDTGVVTDNTVGNLVYLADISNGGDTRTHTLLGASNLSIASTGPTTQNELAQGIDEGSGRAIASQGEGTVVYNYNTWNQLTSVGSGSQQSYLFGYENDWWAFNGQAFVTSNGVYNAETGSEYFGMGHTHAVAIHPEQNTIYRMAGGTVYSYTESGEVIGSTPINSESTQYEFYRFKILKTTQVNGEDKLLYANKQYVGIIDAPTTPKVDGYVHKKNGGRLPNANVTISQSGSDITTVQTNGHGYYSISQPSGTYNMTANKKGWAPDSATITLNNDVRQNFTLINKSGIFDFQVNNWMEHGSTQKYHAYFNAGIYRQSVRANTTITSANTSVITVDSANYSLIATSNTNVSREVSITAAYQRDGVWYNETQNVTVAPLTVEHIDVLPPEQWIPAALGFGEKGTVFGMGSEIQWILLAVFTGSGAAWFARNEWIGVGVILGCNILFWALGNISLGILLVALFYGLFVAYQLNKIPSRSDTNVGGIQDQPEEINRPSDRYK